SVPHRENLRESREVTFTCPKVTTHPSSRCVRRTMAAARGKIAVDRESRSQPRVWSSSVRGARCARGKNHLSLEQFDCAIPAIIRGRWRRDHCMSAFPYLYTISGFAVGLLVGMTGIGGGSLMTPILILLFGIHPAAAVGTDLLHAAATKTAGSIVHGLKGSIDWTVVRRLAMGSVPMTIVTIASMSLFDINGNTGRNVVNAVLTIALIATAIALVFRGRIVARYADRIGGLGPQQVATLTTIVGGVLGMLVSLSSVGAGAIGVTCLLLLYPKLPAV